jgi:CubicO group peptidase (beta-lactamase class C family)
MPFWDTDHSRLMDEALVPGVAVAIVRNGKLAELASYGVRGIENPAPVDENTIFDAASLSKPVFAYLVLLLVDQGVLELDATLCDYLPNYITADSRSSSIRINHILSHSAGLPNWRNLDHPLRTYFVPGERFSYSGEGFLYLQKAIEIRTGKNLETLARSLVFEPLEMNRSSFSWQSVFDENRAYPHDPFGTPALGNKPALANAAWSLQTCAADYARFLLAVLHGSQLSSENTRLWLSPRIHVKHPGIECLGPSDGEAITGVAWGLGWGLEPELGSFFHWGANGPFTAFTVGMPQSGDALVVFTNGASGLSVMPELVARFTPGERPSLRWLDHVRHDAPVRRLLRVALAQGPEAAWPEIKNAGLEREQLVWIAQGLNVRGYEKESFWLRARVNEI